MNRIVFISSGDFDSPMGIRARGFAVHLQKRWDVSIIYKKKSRLSSLINNLVFLFRFKPKKVVVLDCHLSGILAGIVYFLFTGKSYFLDTGDAVFELGKAIGRVKSKQFLTYLLEFVGNQLALRIIVRGRNHLKFLGNKSKNAVWIPDGVDIKQFRNDSIRKKNGKLVIGIVGSLNWNEKTGYCYGMELIDVVDGLTRQINKDVDGIIIGDGSGLGYLKKRVVDLGLSQRIHFLGKVKYDNLPSLISNFSIALSFQTNDVVGQVRTTGKLPLYLSSGCFIICTNVGEASRILPGEMLIDLSDSSFSEFSKKCIDLIINKLRVGDEFEYKLGPVIAKKYFDYRKLSLRLENALATKHKNFSNFEDLCVRRQ